MGVRSKKITLLTILTGGVLLAAVWHSGNAFALSDTSSDTTTTPATSQTTPTTDTTTTSPDPSTTTQPSSAVAGGSTATQVDTNSVGTGSSLQTDPTTSSTSPLTTTPQGSSSTTQNNGTNLNNNVNATSQSGDANVSFNQKGGNATTGNSGDTTTVINSVGSSSNLSGSGGPQTFTDNVNGTQNGNLSIDPSKILPPTSTNATVMPTQTDATDQNDTNVNNNINLTAVSGDAGVNNNGVGGNATTGNATTDANLINLVESAIDDKQSFIGVINIYGTLNGNIVLPANLVNSLMTNKSGVAGTGSGSTSSANNVQINNSVSLTALSGMAMVLNNGRAGNATSGNATTALNIYDLVNSQIVGGNVLLVFVNVMGSWYGLLLNAPAGSTSAMLGGGIQQDNVSPASVVNATNNVTINNVVNLWSQTGNATVSANGVGGNATTGNASASADIVNIVGTQINLTGWLGILIINVFGTWNGSLVVQAPVVNGGAHHLKPTKHHASSLASDPAIYALFSNPTQTGVVASAAHDLSDPASIFADGINNTKLARVSDKVSSDGLLVGLISIGLAGIAAAVAVVSHKKIIAKS